MEAGASIERVHQALFAAWSRGRLQLLGSFLRSLRTDVAGRLTWGIIRIDPAIVTQIENIASEVPGFRSSYNVRARWAGHRLLAELTIGVAADLTVAQGHRIAEQVQHRLMHSVTKFQWGSIHVVQYDNGRPPDLEMIEHHMTQDSSDPMSYPPE